MYIPPQFEFGPHDHLYHFINTYSFGQLVSIVDERLYSTHVPFLLSDTGKKIFTHVAKRNPQWENIVDQEIMITLEGPHTYVSPSCYQSVGVPTWNYQAVHIYGTCRIIDNDIELSKNLNRLTKKFESAEEQPWEPNYQNSLLNAIVGIEVKISDIKAKSKLSQNRPLADQNNVIKRLADKSSLGNEKKIADLMQRNLK